MAASRKFKAKPGEEQHATAVAQFAAGAFNRSVHPGEPYLDPKAKPTNGINLRLNDYELDLIRRLAQADDRSIQQTLKLLLFPAAQEKLQSLSES